MAREAERLIADAERLRQSLSTESHSADLLDLLALEILLKCCVALETGRLAHGHDYVHIFLKLSSATRKRLVESAVTRTGPAADYSDLYWLLSLFSSNFIRLRYPYETYSDLSETEYLRLGSEWIEGGAKLEDATFDFRLAELHGLLYALSRFASERLAG